MTEYQFYWPIVWNAMPDLLSGAWVTIQITVLAFLLGTAIAFPMSIARRVGAGPQYRVATAWVEISRNTPSLFQLYMMYFGLGALGINISSYLAVLSAVTFNNAGYMAEIFRGGLGAVPNQQQSAARSLGMSRFQAYLHVIFPQVLKIVFFAYVTQGIWGMLNSALGMMVGLDDLSGAANYAQAVSFRSFEFFLVTAAMYYIMAKGLQFSAQIAYRLLYKG